jgi:DNA replicative helicase MCM subunit Mcm2 (Cdc46/Mcm family)
MDSRLLKDEVVAQRVRLAEEFLDPSDQRARSYRADILLMLNQKRRRLHVSLDAVREHSREMSDGLLSQPFDYSAAFNQALKNIVKALSNRPAHESGEDVVRWARPQCSWTVLTLFRCTIAHTRAASASSRAIHARSARRTSTI